MIKRIKNLQAFKTLNSPERNSCIDICRAAAIITVVLFHFNGFLPYGNLGVDLFFVISGLLVGGLLTRKAKRGARITFFKFFLQRGFKIWPSYFVFLILGNFLSFLLYRNIHRDYVIPLWDLKRYLFFYQNYTGAPFHWIFDHVWSLCVEEHFYIILPIAFIAVILIFRKQARQFLFLTISLMIFSGILLKYVTILYTNSKETYASTHTRIDALGWGVLLTLIITYYPQWLKKKKIYLLSIAGVFLAGMAIGIDYCTTSVFYKKVIFHSLIPFAFFLVIAGLYYTDFSKLKTLRFISYYSYNWYLWHLLLMPLITLYFGASILGLGIFLAASFLLAVLFTVVVEEPFLKLRQPALARLSISYPKLFG